VKGSTRKKRSGSPTSLVEIGQYKDAAEQIKKKYDNPDEYIRAQIQKCFEKDEDGKVIGWLITYQKICLTSPKDFIEKEVKQIIGNLKNINLAEKPKSKKAKSPFVLWLESLELWLEQAKLILSTEPVEYLHGLIIKLIQNDTGITTSLLNNKENTELKDAFEALTLYQKGSPTNFTYTIKATANSPERVTTPLEEALRVKSLSSCKLLLKPKENLNSNVYKDSHENLFKAVLSGTNFLKSTYERIENIHKLSSVKIPKEFAEANPKQAEATKEHFEQIKEIAGWLLAEKSGFVSLEQLKDLDLKLGKIVELSSPVLKTDKDKEKDKWLVALKASLPTELFRVLNKIYGAANSAQRNELASSTVISKRMNELKRTLEVVKFAVEKEINEESIPDDEADAFFLDVSSYLDFVATSGLTNYVQAWEEENPELVKVFCDLLESAFNHTEVLDNCFDKFGNSEKNLIDAAIKLQSLMALKLALTLSTPPVVEDYLNKLEFFPLHKVAERWCEPRAFHMLVDSGGDLNAKKGNSSVFDAVLDCPKNKDAMADALSKATQENIVIDHKKKLDMGELGALIVNRMGSKRPVFSSGSTDKKGGENSGKLKFPADKKGFRYKKVII